MNILNSKHAIRGAALIVSMFLSGCSTSSYVKQIDSFASSTQTLSENFSSLATRESQVLEAEILNRHLSPEWTLNFQIDGSCNELDNIAVLSQDESTDIKKVLEKARDCRIKYTATSTKSGQSDDKEYFLVNPEPVTKNAVALSNQIQMYSNHLKSIANAENINELEASLTDFTKTIGTFGDTVNSITDTEVNTEFSDSFSPILGFFNYVTLSYINYRKNTALRDAVKTADPLIKKSATILKQIARDANIIAVQADYVAVRRQVHSLDDKSSDYDTLITGAQNAQSRLDAFKGHEKSDPSKSYDSLVTSHEKLLGLASDSSAQFKEAIKAIDEFKTAVESLQSSSETTGAEQ